MNLQELSIAKIHKGLANKEFSAIELIRAFLENIEKKDKKILSYITISAELALEQAKKIDDLISAGNNLPVLAGVPLAIKDNIMIKGLKNTCGSKILENYIAPYDAACVKKLKNFGAIILGKTNLDEFAMGSSTENSAFFTTKNPRDLTRIPGGSSGGSAAAVASNLCCCALGSDTGGSIRLPASFCGVVGLKPTYGAVSRFGLVAFASSLDQIGPITKTAEDAEIVFNAISGKDPLDSTSIDVNSKPLSVQILRRKNCGRQEAQNSKPQLKIQNLRVGVPKEYFIQGIDAEVREAIKKAIKKIEGLGAKIEEISLPHTEYAIPVYYIISTSEASANLARYDGIKYGLSETKGKNLHEVYLKTREEGFGQEVKRRIMLGTYALSTGYYDAYYLKAEKVRTLLIEDFEKAFKKVDVIFTPVSPTPAFKIGEKSEDPLSMYLSDIFTVSANLTGLPAISVPAGFAKGGLPVGLQIIGKPFEEEKILKVSQFFQ